MKAYPPSSGLLFIVNTAHTKVVGRSWTDGLKNGTISTVFIKNTEGALGSQHTQKQCKRK